MMLKVSNADQENESQSQGKTIGKYFEVKSNWTNL